MLKVVLLVGNLLLNFVIIILFLISKLLVSLIFNAEVFLRLDKLNNINLFNFLTLETLIYFKFAGFNDVNIL